MKMNVRSDGASPSKNVRKYDGWGAVATQGNDGEGAVATQVFPGRGVLQGVETYDGNHLPHWTMGHVLYHVCFRLADSVPVEKLREWQNERKAFAELRSDGASPSKEKAELRSDGASPSGSDTQRLKYLYSEKIEKYLDSGYGECLLRSDGALAVVRATIKHDDGKKYHIHAYGIMPNHVHVIVELKEGFLLRDVMQEWKSVSGHRINRMLSRTGALWQPDYYNHIIRTPDEYGFQMNYVFKNNLVESWRLPSNDESGNDGEGAVATQGNDGEGEGNDGEGEGNDGEGAPL